MAQGILDNAELEHYISSFETSLVEHIGGKKWFKRADIALKLYQVAILEARNEGAEERIKNLLIEHNKVGVILNELICISAWKDNIIPELMLLSPEPSHFFPTYFVMYYEVLIIGLLQTVLFFADTFDYIEDSIVDLVDYSVSHILKLNPDVEMKAEIKEGSTVYNQINIHKEIMDFNIGTSCIGLLRYVIENLERFPLSVASNIYSVHDLPILLTCLIENNIWTRRKNDKDFKFFDNDWREWNEGDPPLSPTECQLWLLLRQLLLDPCCLKNYEFTAYHKEQLSKLNKYLHTAVLDQLSPLVDLKHWLHQISITTPSCSAPRVPLIIEVTPKYKDVLHSRYEKKWSKIAKEKSQFLFYSQPEEIRELAEALSMGFDKLDDVVENCQTCSLCFTKANKKCSRCKKVWYCSRKCQVGHWKSHKNVCL